MRRKPKIPKGWYQVTGDAPCRRGDKFAEFYGERWGSFIKVPDCYIHPYHLLGKHFGLLIRREEER